MTDWDAGGWEGAHQAQVEAWLATSAEQRLAWLEEAIAFVRATNAALPGADDPPPLPNR